MLTYICDIGKYQIELQLYSGVLTFKNCEVERHPLKGITRTDDDNSITISRDGCRVWSGTGLEAADLLARLLQPSCKIDPELLKSLTEKSFEDLKRDGFIFGEQADEADRVVRGLACLSLSPTAIDETWRIRDSARRYVAKYPKT